MTYVLVHGGGATARFWDRVLPHLDGRVLAVDLPGRNGKPADLPTLTVDDEVASVLADIDAANVDDDIVLVAHSSGGLVVPGVVAARRDQVGRIVLNAALVPPEGGCGLDCLKPAQREGLVLAVEDANRNGTAITLPGPPPDPEAFRTAYGTDPLDDDALAFVVDPVRCVPDTVHHYFQPVTWSAARGMPVAYVVNDRDRPVPTPLQEEMLRQLPDPPEVLRLDCGHIPAVTHPAGLATAINGLGHLRR
jgi:pimeloyl-ACP methyl ester carboxylesterase